MKLIVNEREYEIEAGGGERLLWVPRDRISLTGTKFGCGAGQCGCCTVLVEGKAARSCITPINRVAGRRITTIEGIPEGHPVKRAWLELQVPQCGYCQSGQIMQAISLLSENPIPSEDEIREGMNGNLCRYGTYVRIIEAVKRASELGKAGVTCVKKEKAKRYPLNRWVSLGDDGSVIVLLNKSEMGQGVSTALPQIIAEEMDADWDLVSFEFSPANEEYNDPTIGSMETGGSTSIRNMLDEMKRAGGEAREKVLMAASSVFGARKDELRTENGRVYCGERSLGYGELAELASGQNAEEYEVRDVVSKDMPRKGLEGKVNGRALFGIDVYAPGVVYAAVVRAPAYGSALLSFEADGVKALQISNGIALLGDSMEDVWSAGERVRAEWSEVVALDDDTVRKELESALDAAERCSVRGAIGGRELLKARYMTQYLSHAPMEPMNCVVWVREERCEVWAPTQVQTEALETVREVTGMKDVELHTTYLGGGFGRRLKSDFIREAAEISMRLKKPVKLLWTREEDLAYDFYRPGAIAEIKGYVDDGTLGVEFIVASQPVHEEGTERETDPATVAGIANTLYDIDIRIRAGRVSLPLCTGPWRFVGNSNNAFFMESFVDEVAYALGRDPLEYRISLLKDERARSILKRVADMSGWGKDMEEGHAQGIAFHSSFGSYCAEVAEVRVKDRIRVENVFAAMDCGRTINKGIIQQQVEGAVLMGLSAALSERMSFKNSFAATRNFDTYRMLRIRDAPLVEVSIADSPESPGGVGEPALPPVAPAVANAVFRATGVRLRETPLDVSYLRIRHSLIF